MFSVSVLGSNHDYLHLCGHLVSTLKASHSVDLGILSHGLGRPTPTILLLLMVYI